MPALAGAVALGLSGCGDDAGGSSPTSDRAVVTPPIAPPPSTASVAATASPPTTAPGVEPAGFGMVAGRVIAADGTVCDVCLWLAELPADRGRGLMGVTDLGGLDGMAFVYAEPTSTAFYMKDTLLALSIAFFSADGALLGAFDMDPCAVDPCPTYPTPDGFSVAVEVPQGRLDELGIGAGARLELAGDCPIA